MTVGVVHSERGGGDAKGVADFLEHGLHRSAQLGVGDGRDLCLKFSPERLTVLGRCFHQVAHEW